MNGDIDTRPELADYLRRVRAALADLPPEELAEVMEDVEPHVTEVFGEADTPEEVTTRLGTPEDYAAELRAAGGYPPPGTPVGRPRAVRGRYVFWITALVIVVAALTGLSTVDGYTGEHFVFLALFTLAAIPALWLVFGGLVRRSDIATLPEYALFQRLGRSAVGVLPVKPVRYLRTLQPAWWLARIVLLALGFLAALDVRAAGLLVILGIAALLLWCGAKVRTDRRLLMIVIPANAFAIGLGLALAAAAVSGVDRNPYYVTGYSTSGLTYEGSRLSNVYAVGADGRPLTEFYLYDETGRPLNVYHPDCDRTRMPVEDEYRNRFPLPRVSYDTGVCTELTDLPFVPLIPGPSAATTPSVTTTPSAPSASVSTSPPVVTTTK
ncbi:DUF1700 domain-containing protein [Actinokineospora sp.]|uniref:DUF1700 domain-containing protein n=1 Tax=Actinokineospora sp. TaxID=1872133 RepID=UPI0040376C42